MFDKENGMKKYNDCPQLLRDFMTYHETIKGQSPRTINEYYLDLILLSSQLILPLLVYQ